MSIVGGTALTEEIVGLLSRSDVSTLNKYLVSEHINKNQIHHLLRYVRPFNPTDELIDFLLEIGDKDIAGDLAYILSLWNNFDQLKNILPLVNDKYDILAQLIRNYSLQSLPQDVLLSMRISILIFINYLENILTLDDILSIYYDAMPYSNIKFYVRNDIILYMAFRIISDQVLSTASKTTINTLAEWAIENNAPSYLTDTLLKYVDDPTSLIDEVIINGTGILTKPDDYVSFFQDDV